MLRRLLMLFAVLAACSGPEAGRSRSPSVSSPDVASTDAPAGDDTPPALRLPRIFVPSASRVALRIDPGAPRFSGHVEIDGAVSAPTPLLWLHARKLDISKAVAVAGGKEIALSARLYGEEMLALRAPSALPAGAVTIRIDFEGTQEEKETAGMFRQRSGDAWYTLTQFESTYARRAFPSFDEPDVKIPWQLTIDVPAGHSAFANTSPEAQEKLPDGTRFRFATTKPMPSYLVAFAVGPFDVVNAAKSKRGVPVRIIVPRGRGRDAAFAAQVTPKILDAVEAWFGTPYPYDKLDSIVIPVTVGFGAMENAGLITYAESRMLIDPSDTSLDRRYRYASTATHEIAHQWFGNLVTPVWWDDIWLNEGFASWITDKIVADQFPQWSAAMASQGTRLTALASDGLTSARRVRQPIATEHDIDTAFDSITYRKGASVLRMFEHWVGPEVFQKGVRAYLARHAWGNATSRDFVTAISEASGKDVATAFSTFLDQPGLPRLAIELTCAPGAAPKITLTQGRYLPHGAAEVAAPQPWQVPVCIAYPLGAKRASACALVDGQEAEIPLEGKACPAWFYGNTNGVGYYRTGMTEAQLDALVVKGWPKLNAGERLALFDDVVAMAERGDVPVTVALGLVPKMAQEKSRYAIDSVVDMVAAMESNLPPGTEAAWRAWIVKTLGARARVLGWLPRGDGIDGEVARVKLVALVADAGEPTLRRSAVQLASRWRQLPAAMRRPVLSVAIDEPAVFGAVMAAVVSEPDRKIRIDLLDALGGSRNTQHLRTALALLLDERIDPRDAEFMYKPTKHRPEMRAVVEAFWRENATALLARLPRRQASKHAEAFTNVCDGARRDAIATSAQQTLGSLPGGPRRVPQAIESMDQCIARSAMFDASLRAWLAPQRTGANAVRPPRR